MKPFTKYQKDEIIPLIDIAIDSIEDAKHLQPLVLDDGTVIVKADIYFECKSCRGNLMYKSAFWGSSLYYYVIGFLTGGSICLSIATIL